MLSEEEKKAIGYLKFYIERDVMYEDTHYEQIKTLLNLIEKQSKEIETLKKENLEIRDWKYTIDTIEDLDKLKELDLIKIKGKEYISKDKIKAKIENFKKVRDTILENEAEYKRPMMTYDLIRNDYCEKMLQELLEEE